MKLHEEFKLYETIWDTLTEAPKQFTDREMPPDLTPSKVYVLKDNYWITTLEQDFNPDNEISEHLLDPSSANIKYVKDTYTHNPKEVKPCNANGELGDAAIMFPKGTKIRFVKDIDLEGKYPKQLFNDGKVSFLFDHNGINKYLQ